MEEVLSRQDAETGHALHREAIGAPRHAERRWPDKALCALLLVYGVLWFPLVGRSTSNPHLLAAFINDEPPITQQLLGMTVPPYGNPANYLQAPQRVPEYWGNLLFSDYIYYGGAYLDFGFLLYMPLKQLGAADFPAAAICLRLVSALAGMVALVMAYLLAKRLGGPAAGWVAGLLLLTDISLSCYSSIIHPDTTMLAFALLALWAGIRHAETGRLGMLLSLGALAGLVHGAKMGGPWTVPMAVTAVLLGARRASFGWNAKGVRALLGRLALWGTSAAAGFFLCTPYALFDSYYFRMISTNASFFRTSPWSQANAITWIEELWAYLGPFLGSLALASVACVALAWLFRHNQKTGLLLTVVLGLSVVLWYSLVIRLWVCVPYLLTALAVLYVLVGALVSFSFHWLRRQGSMARALLVLLCLVGIGLICITRGVDVAIYALGEHCRDRISGIAVGRWAVDNLPHHSKILYDDAVYFDKTIFPNARLHGGLLTYRDLETQRPDYFILSASVYSAEHYVGLRRTQTFARGSEGEFSVLLYQDLLDRGGVPEAELVKVFTPSFRGGRFEALLAYARGFLGQEEFLMGHELRLFRYRPERAATVVPAADPPSYVDSASDQSRP
ncbi:MAG: glycosyltransferase family 39 protein [Gemmataceae bacterium]|nr:glycosyltransferase family 39 protein [Gemmataceae bacterium]